MRRWFFACLGLQMVFAWGLLADASGAATSQNDRFELSAELEARVATHHDLFTRAGESLDDFCRLTADTVDLLDPIVRELSQFGGTSVVPFTAVQRAYTRTERLVPGLSLVATEEVMQTGIDYRSLAKLAQPEARPLLKAMAGFERGPDGIESWGVRVTDASICEAPERGRGALTALVKSWPVAPSCLRDALRGRLKAELEQMTGWTCFCGEREPALAAVRKSAKVLKALADIGGPELADRWLEVARATDTRFACHPG
jgi:hypothetical protein